MDFWAIFITGLTVGGLTCLAVQGGLLASVIAVRKEETSAKSSGGFFLATGAFLVTKLIAYVALGFILGWFGGLINISSSVQITMQLAAGIYMLAVAGNLLNLHPLFRYAIIQPPRFLTRLVRNQSRSKDIFAPALLGAMTVFIPCGTTLAIEALVISGANPWVGATIMGVFVMGTIPLFFGIGFITSLLGETFRAKFFKLAALAVIYLGVTSISGALIALGVPLSLSSSPNKLYSESPTTQSAEIFITSSGYSPSYLRVKKDLPVTLKLVSRDAYSCALAFRIPSLGISRDLGANETQTITFTPTKAGKIPFSCSMGMYRGVIEVL